MNECYWMDQTKCYWIDETEWKVETEKYFNHHQISKINHSNALWKENCYF